MTKIKYLFFDALKEPSEFIYATDFKDAAVEHYKSCLSNGAKLQVAIDGFLLYGSPEEILKKF